MVTEPCDNPFLIVYSALYDMVAKDSRFSVVKPKNQIRFDSDTNRDPLKLNPITADYPETTLIPLGVQEGNLQATSSSSRLVYAYSWIIATGDYRYKDISAVEWAVYSASSKWCDEITTLLWGDHRFVTRFNLVSSTMGETENLKRRGINGWATSWTAHVLMDFTTRMLREGVN